jgi:hypothetical protein
MIRFRKWYRQYLQDVTHGRTLVISLLQAVAELRERLARADSATLIGLANEIDATLEADATTELRRLLAGTSASNLDCDQLARDGAKSNLVRLLQRAGKVEALWRVGVATIEHGWTYPRPSSQLQAVGSITLSSVEPRSPMTSRLKTRSVSVS